MARLTRRSAGLQPGGCGTTVPEWTRTTCSAAQPAAAANSTPNAAVVWAGVPIVPPGTNNTRTSASRTFAPTLPAFLASDELGSHPDLRVPVDLGEPVVGLEQPATGRCVRTAGLAVRRSFLQRRHRSLRASYSAPRRTVRLFTNPSASGPFGAQLGLRFREGFQTAFKTRLDPTQGLAFLALSTTRKAASFGRTGRNSPVSALPMRRLAWLPASRTFLPALGSSLARIASRRTAGESVRRQLRRSSFPPMRMAPVAALPSVARSSRRCCCNHIVDLRGPFCRSC